MPERLIPVVDELDNVIAIKPRNSLDPEDRVRITAVWLENSQDEVLLAQRSLQKVINPGKWGPAASGTVEVGESYHENAYKELGEEIGVYDVVLRTWQKVLYSPQLLNGNNRFCYWFRGQLDRPTDEFSLQTEEVIAVRWIGKRALRNEIFSYPERFVGSSQLWLDLFDLQNS